MTLDEIRTRYPHLGLAVYAFDAGMPVTLEVHAPDGQIFTARGATLEAAAAKLFPPEEPETPAALPAPPALPKSALDLFE